MLYCFGNFEENMDQSCIHLAVISKIITSYQNTIPGLWFSVHTRPSGMSKNGALSLMSSNITSNST